MGRDWRPARPVARAAHLVGDRPADEPRVARERVLGQEAERVLHHEIDHRHELLELADVVHLPLGLVEVEPALAHVLEPVAQAVLERYEPRLAQVRSHLRDGLQLHVLKLVGLGRLGRVARKEAHAQDLLILGLGLDDAGDQLGLGEERAEAELAELLGVVVRRYVLHGACVSAGRDHRGRRVNVAERILICAPDEFLVENYAVHRSRVLEVELVYDACRVEAFLPDPT